MKKIQSKKVQYSKNSLVSESFRNPLTLDEKIEYAYQVWDQLQKTYKSIGGYKSHPTIKDLINDSTIWKLSIKNEEVKALVIYKGEPRGLRKAVGVATDSTRYGITKLHDIFREDFTKRNVFIESSLKLKSWLERNFPEFKVKASDAHEYLKGKKIEIVSEYEYARLIGNELMVKTIFASKSNTQS